ncbi:hypothetical protein SD939_10410 [Lactobacillus crispatus]|uniref:hypothetical protein n=1 Tax=Lactobacillus crispatus TaxID=47770 RepID=UPI0029C3F24A|nr:hypothetical protein [Lactobacillus crispatus]MDX5091618.1 hypothetical protein [Lactobacillus crispatus]
MERISAVVDGQLQAIPVLTADHLIAMSKMRSGISPGCPPDILQDLIQAGLVETINGN